MSAPDDASGYSRTDLISCGFIHTPELKALVEDTRPVADLDVAAFLEIGKVAAALCHGVAVLAHARGSDGELLARGRTVTGFANVEKDYADDAVWSCGLLPRDRNLMPWRIEDRPKAIGANDVQAGLCVGATTSGAEQFAALAVGGGAGLRWRSPVRVLLPFDHGPFAHEHTF